LDYRHATSQKGRPGNRFVETGKGVGYGRFPHAGLDLRTLGCVSCFLGVCILCLMHTHTHARRHAHARTLWFVTVRGHTPTGCTDTLAAHKHA
jgi:hypothetical protein